MRNMGPQGIPTSEAFDAWLRETVALPGPEREQRLTAWAAAPGGRRAHPREEHLLPLMVIAGAGGSDAGSTPYAGTILGLRISAHQFG
jgi:aromatic ring-opening dioxygenase catalytic subunit (LigB family)